MTTAPHAAPGLRCDPDDLAAVLRACTPASQPPETRRGGQTTIPGLTEPLTAREIQVLRLLAAGAPNRPGVKRRDGQQLTGHASHPSDHSGPGRGALLA